MYLLFPGRHQLLTQFQFNYLNEIISTGLRQQLDIHGSALASDEKIEAIVFAVTSANHSNTRRNPLPFYLRAIGLQQFAKDLPVPSYIYGVDDVGNLSSFATYTIKRVYHESEGTIDLRPDNTCVICSTPVLQLYEQLGFRILPAELVDRKTWKHSTALPWDIVERISVNKNWTTDAWIKQHIHPSSWQLWKQYRLGEKVNVLFKDHIISEDGDITTTRDYNTYVRQMDEIAELKYVETAPYIKLGRIGDIGCAVGSWIKLACKDERFRESDFYGIEVARHLFDICQQRRHNGEFQNPFVFFSQRNAVTGLVFDRNSMNTIHTSSLTHEIESYGSHADLLAFIQNRYDELAHGGVWINRDVVGPENKSTTVYLWLNKEDGRNDDWDKIFADREPLANYLQGLSTYGRFLRFARDFRNKEGYHLHFDAVTIDGREVMRLSLRDACEFMSRKDYTDNWQSEMHETFCFWDFTEWKAHLEAIGFSIAPESKAYTNPWIVKHRLEGKTEIYKEAAGHLIKLDYPVTNMLMIAERRK
jgi:hypothetical protein